ncbi:hypothetical protein M2351_007191 [Azospirillum canadense]|nr:hypothetical protein [Azospirillum canadense]
MANKVERRMAREGVLGRSVVVKFKAADFTQFTRSCRVEPTRSAADILRVADEILESEADGGAFRLIGVGCTDLTNPAEDPEPDPFGFSGSP